MDSTAESKEYRMDWLATLRGEAAFLVFISHLGVLPIDSNFSFIIGRSGVTCFFLMTGYLAMTSRSKRNRVQYTINRFIRMYPVYWVLLICYFFLHLNEVSVIQLLANMTYFEEFIGIGPMLGASWMMPILVVFYFSVMIFGVSVFMPKESEKDKIRRGVLLEIICGVFAIILSLLRFFTNKPFPTAFFLLIAVGIIGVYIKLLDDSTERIKTKLGYLIPILVVFEFLLVVSAAFSYREEWIFYEIAYNLGILLFVLYKFLNISKGFINKFFSELGKIGFTFFLGAEIECVKSSSQFHF